MSTKAVTKHRCVQWMLITLGTFCMHLAFIGVNDTLAWIVFAIGLPISFAVWLYWIVRARGA